MVIAFSKVMTHL